MICRDATQCLGEKRLTSCSLIAQDDKKHGKVVGQKDEVFIKCRYLGTGLSRPYNEVAKEGGREGDMEVIG